MIFYLSRIWTLVLFAYKIFFPASRCILHIAVRKRAKTLPSPLSAEFCRSSVRGSPWSRVDWSPFIFQLVVIIVISNYRQWFPNCLAYCPLLLQEEFTVSCPLVWSAWDFKVFMSDLQVVKSFQPSSLYLNEDIIAGLYNNCVNSTNEYKRYYYCYRIKILNK